MKTKTKTPQTFANLPKDYAGLCALYLPRPIHDAAEFEEVSGLAVMFAGFEDSMSEDQLDYLEMLHAVTAAWEADHVKWEEVSPLESLKFLLEENGMSGADLSRLLGSDRTLGTKILRGDREITASHARILAGRFNVDPGLFIGAAKVSEPESRADMVKRLGKGMGTAMRELREDQAKAKAKFRAKLKTIK